MSHKGVEALGQTTREAFDTFWKHRGWTEVPAATAQAGEVLGKPVSSLDNLDENELKTVAAQHGVAFDDKAKKADLVKALSESPTTIQEGA
ncbi:hypothetical protein [Kocuria rosea]|uniref:hypothetical protein n=1 Tax=Kocuria rosea TaxID=1275 RepID=UPI00119F5B5A|nr:hypothetical protein [Kocuria rosea]